MKLFHAPLAVILAATGGVSVWQVMAADPVADPAPAPANINPGIAACLGCHKGPDLGSAIRFVKDYKSDEFVRLNESMIWESHDPHSKAFSVLKTPLGEQMGKNLNYKDVTTEVACLACHAMDIDPYKKDKKPSDFVAQDSLGIGCQGCHGLQSDWQSKHYEEAFRNNGSVIPWRESTPEEKGKAGLKNLRDPQVKAAHCATCHVGDPEMGRVVTHAMYAAGHPPLLPYELSTYTSDQPRHWGTPFDPKLKYFHSMKPEKAHKLFSFYPDEGQAGYDARHVAIGAVMGLNAEAKLLAHESDKATPAGLDYARFDCYACHHDLKVPSARQERGYEGAPGRPPLKAWNGALTGVIAAHAAQTSNTKVAEIAKQFPDKWKATQQAAYAKPLGDPVAMKKAAAELSAWSLAFANALQSSPIYTPEEAKKLQAMLVKAAADKKYLADAEAVMALVWASRALDNQTADWSSLAELLPISVRTPSEVMSKTPTTVGDLLKDRMRLFNGYDAEKFKAHFPPKPSTKE